MREGIELNRRILNERERVPDAPDEEIHVSIRRNSGPELSLGDIVAATELVITELELFQPPITNVSFGDFSVRTGDCSEAEASLIRHGATTASAPEFYQRVSAL